MQVHRSAHARKFIVLPNALLQDRRLSYTARGLLADLLSRPDGWREDGRQMADSSTQGRGAIRKALKELTAAGYYRVDTLRMKDGTIRSEAHVFDTPQLELPGVPHPASGQQETGLADASPVKDLGKAPTLPGEPVNAQSVNAEATGEPRGRKSYDIIKESSDEQVRAAVVTLFGVIKSEPRLHVGEAEALELAPLVAQWLERGASSKELTQALLVGLPSTVVSPTGLLRSRLRRKMPPLRFSSEPAAHKPAYSECHICHDPVLRQGICRSCAGLSTPSAAIGGGEAVTPSGARRVREAMRSSRVALGIRGVALATQ
ncbi:hypothetical protein P3T36_007268 [Kitasatospora sp. MAP12-15]|uniref:hypothetical protein n=1 Tax=unclassified Kitasatospora TaxID=2633591 RepID=UPI002473C3E6|nr:hypothetical protein [Kitasatospora sp. MAP12-44]MDH6115651.1 hypothetical protein [Kitasatospora sp. MAP12-44]